MFPGSYSDPGRAYFGKSTPVPAHSPSPEAYPAAYHSEGCFQFVFDGKYPLNFYKVGITGGQLLQRSGYTMEFFVQLLFQLLLFQFKPPPAVRHTARNKEGWRSGRPPSQSSGATGSILLKHHFTPPVPTPPVRRESVCPRHRPLEWSQSFPPAGRADCRC